MKKEKQGFTLSEVIITLVVIGVVAAITVPMMSSNAHDKKWNVARQKAKATIGEAFRLMTVNGEISTTNPDGTPRTTEYMVTKVLPKYLKLEKTCTPANYSQCGFPATVKTPSGGSIGVTPNNYKWSELTYAYVWNNYPPDNVWRVQSYTTTFTGKYGNTHNTSYYFRTLDGFSVAFLYNPYCATDKKDHYTTYAPSTSIYVQQSLDIVCLMGIYDMNGKKGPNKVGMDIGFIGSFYNGFETRTAAILPHSTEKVYNASGLTGSTTWDKFNNYCNNLSKDKEWIMPDLYETVLLYLNNRLVTNQLYAEKRYYTRTSFPGEQVYHIGFGSDTRGAFNPTGKNLTNFNGPYVRCVRANALK